MPLVNVLNDPDTGGGQVTPTKQTWFNIDGLPVVTDGDPVSAHPPCPDDSSHCNATTANGVSWFLIDGIPVNVEGDVDTCGHTRTHSQTWFNITH